MNCIPANWPAPKHIKAYTTIKPHFNVVNGFRDAQEQQELITLLRLPAAPFWLNQTHSTQAVNINNDAIFPQADAAYTNENDKVCLVLTADCLPIFLCDARGQEVAAIHAGWRGLCGGIIENTVRRFQQPQTLLAYLGPAISQPHFEVGMDVYEAFLLQNPANIDFFVPTIKDKWLCDLYGIARFQLYQLGISAIYGGNYCTFRDSQLFYSYRRDSHPTGRLANVIWKSSTTQ